MKINKGTVIAIVAVVAVILGSVVGITSVPGNAIKYEEKVTEARSAINIQEKSRNELLPNLADCVKSYDKHEYDTLVDIVKERKNENGNFSDEAVNEVMKSIHIVMEDYPELSSQKNYQEFMNELSKTENKIINTREAYNKAVSRYNSYTKHPLRKFFLSLTGYERIEFQKLSYDVSDTAPTNLFD